MELSDLQDQNMFLYHSFFQELVSFANIETRTKILEPK